MYIFNYMIKSRFIKTMEALSKSGDLGDKELLDIVNTGTQRTKTALVEGAKENQKFRQFLTLQDTITTNAETFLAESTTSFQKFKALIDNPSGTGGQRFLKSVTFGIYNPNVKLTPDKVANTVIDLYNNQKSHLGAVQTSYDLLQNRRILVYGIARDAAQSIKEHTLEYKLAERQIQRINSLYTTLDNMVLGKEGLIGELKSHLDTCTEANLFDGSEIIERIDAGDDISADLYLIKEDVDFTRANVDDTYRAEGLEIKGGSTLLLGLDLQKRQFDETIKGLGVQVQELDIDLRYTKELAKNTFYLSKAQGVSQNALDSFMVYKKTMNDVQMFNSLGARVMLDRVGFLMTTPFFDPEVLAQAKNELQQGVAIFAEKEKQFHGNVQGLIQKLDMAGAYAPQNLRG